MERSIPTEKEYHSALHIVKSYERRNSDVKTSEYISFKCFNKTNEWQRTSTPYFMTHSENKPFGIIPLESKSLFDPKNKNKRLISKFIIKSYPHEALFFTGANIKEKDKQHLFVFGQAFDPCQYNNGLIHLNLPFYVGADEWDMELLLPPNSESEITLLMTPDITEEEARTYIEKCQDVINVHPLCVYVENNTLEIQRYDLFGEKNPNIDISVITGSHKTDWYLLKKQKDAGRIISQRQKFITTDVKQFRWREVPHLEITNEVKDDQNPSSRTRIIDVCSFLSPHQYMNMIAESNLEIDFSTMKEFKYFINPNTKMLIVFF